MRPAPCRVKPTWWAASHSVIAVRSTAGQAVAEAGVRGGDPADRGQRGEQRDPGAGHGARPDGPGHRQRAVVGPGRGAAPARSSAGLAWSGRARQARRARRAGLARGLRGSTHGPILATPDGERREARRGRAGTGTGRAGLRPGSPRPARARGRRPGPARQAGPSRGPDPGNQQARTREPAGPDPGTSRPGPGTSRPGPGEPAGPDPGTSRPGPGTSRPGPGTSRPGPGNQQARTGEAAPSGRNRPGGREQAGQARRMASRARTAVPLGVRPTRTPAFSSASFLAWAVPAEPEMMAPACPIVLPSGAVKPAT